MSVPEGFDYNEAVQYKTTTLNKSSNRAAIYYPHVTIIDPVTTKQVNFPAGSMAAGIYARTDETKNVSKAPAGTVDGALRFATGVEVEMTPAQSGVVNLAHVNSNCELPIYRPGDLGSQDPRGRRRVPVHSNAATLHVCREGGL